MPACVTAGQHLICCHPILGCVPIVCHRWCYCQKRVVVAKFSVGTERTLTVHALPMLHTSLPLMRQSTGTLVTCPPDKPIAARLNLYVSQGSIPGMMPLFLQLCLQQADVWPLVLQQGLLDLFRGTAPWTSSCGTNKQWGWRYGYHTKMNDHITGSVGFCLPLCDRRPLTK